VSLKPPEVKGQVPLLEVSSPYLSLEAPGVVWAAPLVEAGVTVLGRWEPPAAPPRARSGLGAKWSPAL
jgi:hypothetical protein